MTALALALAASLAVACVVAVALPFLREPEPDEDRLDEPDALERRRLELAEERDRVLADLKELEFDHRTGKVSDEDYRALIGPLRSRAAAALRALEPDLRRSSAMSEPQPPEPAEPVRVPEPFPPPDEGDPPQQPPIPEPFPPPDEGDRPQQPTIPEPGPTS
ncbi:MAG: hypothetical protein ACRDKU_00780 [Gaiellaceae bacterium]